MASLRTRRPRLDPDAFIAAAEDAPSSTPAAAASGNPSNDKASNRPSRKRSTSSRRGEVKPWKDPSVRTDMIKAFNLRLPEPLKLKLDYIRARTRVSVHEFIMDALVPAVDREIERLEGE